MLALSKGIFFELGLSTGQVADKGSHLFQAALKLGKHAKGVYAGDGDTPALGVLATEPRPTELDTGAQQGNDHDDEKNVEPATLGALSPRVAPEQY